MIITNIRQYNNISDKFIGFLGITFVVIEYLSQGFIVRYCDVLIKEFCIKAERGKEV